MAPTAFTPAPSSSTASVPTVTPLGGQLWRGFRTEYDRQLWRISLAGAKLATVSGFFGFFGPMINLAVGSVVGFKFTEKDLVPLALMVEDIEEIIAHAAHRSSVWRQYSRELNGVIDDTRTVWRGEAAESARTTMGQGKDNAAKRAESWSCVEKNVEYALRVSEELMRQVADRAQELANRDNPFSMKKMAEMAGGVLKVVGKVAASAANPLLLGSAVVDGMGLISEAPVVEMIRTLPEVAEAIMEFTSMLHSALQDLNQIWSQAVQRIAAGEMPTGDPTAYQATFARRLSAKEKKRCSGAQVQCTPERQRRTQELCKSADNDKKCTSTTDSANTCIAGKAPASSSPSLPPSASASAGSNLEQNNTGCFGHSPVHRCSNGGLPSSKGGGVIDGVTAAAIGSQVSSREHHQTLSAEELHSLVKKEVSSILSRDQGVSLAATGVGEDSASAVPLSSPFFSPENLLRYATAPMVAGSIPGSPIFGGPMPAGAMPFTGGIADSPIPMGSVPTAGVGGAGDYGLTMGEQYSGAYSGNGHFSMEGTAGFSLGGEPNAIPSDGVPQSHHGVSADIDADASADIDPDDADTDPDTGSKDDEYSKSSRDTDADSSSDTGAHTDADDDTDADADTDSGSAAGVGIGSDTDAGKDRHSSTRDGNTSSTGGKDGSVEINLSGKVNISSDGVSSGSDSDSGSGVHGDGQRDSGSALPGPGWGLHLDHTLHGEIDLTISGHMGIQGEEMSRHSQSHTVAADTSHWPVEETIDDSLPEENEDQSYMASPTEDVPFEGEGGEENEGSSPITTMSSSNLAAAKLAQSGGW